MAADALRRDRPPCAARELVRGPRPVERLRRRDALARVRLDLARERLGLVRVVVQRYVTSSCVKSPNASTYVRMSSSECWTEIVHCSSSPGVMKTPRFTIQVNDA